MIIKQLSKETTAEILGDELSYLVGFSATGETTIYTAFGTTAEEMDLPMKHPATEVLGTNSFTAIRTAAKCWAVIGGKVVCVPCR